MSFYQPSRLILIFFLALYAASMSAQSATSKGSVAIIGTGDMGDSLGPRFAGLGYRVIYGSRHPESDSSKALVTRTGNGASITYSKDAAQKADIVVLAVGWPAMRKVATSLGSLDGKIVIDISTAAQQADDGYFESVVETSSAEMIQQWNPGARVVKAFAVQGSFIVDDPNSTGGPISVPIAADDRKAKETVAGIVHAMGMDPFDAGPLRYSREIEAFARLYMVPILQRRQAAWEPYFRRSHYWECVWGDDWSDPVVDSDNLAKMPAAPESARPCPGP